MLILRVPVSCFPFEEEATSRMESLNEAWDRHLLNLEYGLGRKVLWKETYEPIKKWRQIVSWVRSSLTNRYCRNCFWASWYWKASIHCHAVMEKQILVNPSWQGTTGEMPGFESKFRGEISIWGRMSCATRLVWTGNSNRIPKQRWPRCWSGVTTAREEKTKTTQRLQKQVKNFP